MIRWIEHTYGRCPLTGKQIAPMTAAEYAANPMFVDSSDDEKGSLKLLKFRGKIMSQFKKRRILNEEGSRRHSRRSRNMLKLMSRMGFTEGGY